MEWRQHAAGAHENGCSIGVFSAMLAQVFAEDTGVDLSLEAIMTARAQNPEASNLTFVRQDLRRLNLGRTFDVLFCAEVLYYLPRGASVVVCDVLDRHLAQGGIIVLVSGLPTESEGFLYFHDWKRLLRARFAEMFAEVVDDPTRPYDVTIFARSA